MLLTNICKRFLGVSLLLAAFGFTTLNAQTVAYVTNAGDNTVSVIDTRAQSVIATIAVGGAPVGLVFSPDGRRAYVTNSADGSVSVIDTASNTVAATIALPVSDFGPAQPLSPGIRPDGGRLYVPDSFGNAVFIIDTATNTVSNTVIADFSAPISVAITADGLLAYVLNAGNDSVTVLDTATNTQQGSPISTPLSLDFSTTHLVIGPDGRIYLPGNKFTTVNVITGNTLTTIPLPDCAEPTGLVVTPDNARIYETCAYASPGTVAVFDANNPPPATSPTYIPVGSPDDPFALPLNLAITPDGASVYVVNGFENTVSVINTATNTQTNLIGVGQFPGNIAIAKVTLPPTAVAGLNQTIIVGQTVHLDGSGSYAPNTLPADLQYAWSFVSRPSGSTTVLNNADTATPSFITDAVGDYVVQLVVTDPATNLASKPSQVTISSIWSPPTANAGPAQSVATGSLVHLNGLGSTDPNGLPLTYAWSFVSKPNGSAATITPGTLGLASFTTDVVGAYDVQLVVSDQFGSSQPATVLITATTPETSQELLQDVINYIATLPVSSFDSAGHSAALTNQLQQAITDVQKDKISQAIGKIADAITRTDGFPLRGSADGNGQGMDWITNQTDQNFAYEKLTAALSALQQM